MFIAPGFEQRSTTTHLGAIAYAAPQPEFWPVATQPDQTLLFLHGFGGGSSSYEWSQVYPAFATDYRVLAPDLPGWGRSDHLEQAYTIQDYEDAIIKILQALAPQGAVIVASALTAAITVRVAVNHPELIQRLILVTPAGLSDFGKDFRQGLLPQVLQIPWLDKVLYQTAIATAAGIQRFLTERQFANADLVTPEMVAAYLKSATQPNAEYAALSFVRGDLCFDLAEWIPQLTIPTVMLWGQAAQFTEVALGERLAALNSQAIKHFEVINNVGLTPQLEQPGPTTALIRKALDILDSCESALTMSNVSDR
ncbi:alpha/beta hydrolase [Oscillatoria sp. CS-180]|uniref:alpha/beta fold hydrolase n=1 Tax=Oscillatoria sp. CS-180 TaxID=3021720 RepID=UPI00232D4569|nr:alpha/beta hydrolase [Oscillatoria sp. CS-180]MDB9528457.1 alpha/beta hydrolase [Oscillatoria sp. CS-180]